MQKKNNNNVPLHSIPGYLWDPNMHLKVGGLDCGGGCRETGVCCRGSDGREGWVWQWASMNFLAEELRVNVMSGVCLATRAAAGGPVVSSLSLWWLRGEQGKGSRQGQLKESISCVCSRRQDWLCTDLWEPLPPTWEFPYWAVGTTKATRTEYTPTPLCSNSLPFFLNAALPTLVVSQLWWKKFKNFGL